MKLSNSSSVPVYTVSGPSSHSLPEPSQKDRNRKHDPEYANRVELLQDFEFEEASQCVRASEDGDWVMSTGTHRPTSLLESVCLSYAQKGAAIDYLSRYIQATNTHALPAEPLPIMGATYRYPKQDVPDTIIGLL
jgi:ribosome biogenesis protein ENP2